MSWVKKAVLDLRIGTKLAIASGLSLLLVVAMLASQVIGDRVSSAAVAQAGAEQSIAKTAVGARATLRDLSIGVRDMRLAHTLNDIQKVLEFFSARQRVAFGHIDSLFKLLPEGESRATAQRMKTLADKYVEDAMEIVAKKGEMLLIEAQRPANGALTAEQSTQISGLLDAVTEIARTRTDPSFIEIEKLANVIVNAAQKKADEQEAIAKGASELSTRVSLILGLLVAVMLIGSVVFSQAMIAKPMRALSGGMRQLAEGDFDVVLPGLGRKDEIGDVAAAVETFKVKSAERATAEAEAKAELDRQAMAEKAERDRLAADERAERERLDAEEKAERDRVAAAEREAATARIMSEFDAAVGGIVKAAMEGDFSQRVSLDGKQGVIRNLAEGMNAMCENIDIVLDDVSDMLASLAEGDLTRRITADYRGAYGTLKENANVTATRLSETVSSIKLAAAEVASAASEISMSTTDLSQRTEEQAAGLEETSASLEEVSATIKKNADNAQHANALTREAGSVADRGGAVVANAVGAMSRIEESSRRIADIIGVIDEIARQTNLLALNAAVEAARAGEAGRGFAVVASEVRSLAQRSSQAAKDIKDLITSSSGQVREGVDLVNRAGKSLAEIVGSIKSVADIVAEIAVASAEQATAIEQVNKALSQMDEATQQVEENAATAKTLEEQSGAMDQQVNFFRIDDGASRAPAIRRAA
jgi:methyl-accepting chemotaxis protein